MRLKKKISNKPRQKFSGSAQGRKVVSYQNITPASGKTKPKLPRSRSGLVQFIWHLPMWLAGLAIIISFGYSLTLNSNVNLVSLNTANNPLLRDKKTYDETAKKLIENSITAKTKMTFNKDKFISAMKKQFPELTEISVTLPLMGHRPIVKIASNRPVVALENDQNNLFVIDRQGRALMKLDNREQAAQMNLLVLKDQSTTPVELGRHVITEQDAGFITELMAQLDAKNTKITELTLPAIANELHIKVEGKNYVVKFNTLTDARQSAGALLAVKEKFEKENINPTEYIDLRVEEKVYYK